MRAGWVVMKYKDVVDKISTSKHKLKQKEYLPKGKIAVIDQGQESIGGYTNDKSKILKCRLPVIVFGDHTKVVKLINFPFAPGADGTKVLQPKEFLLPKYLKYLTQVLVHKIKDRGYARHYQHIEKQEFPIAPLLEQHIIVAKIEQLFSELDNGIANLRSAEEKLNIYRQAVLKKAFEGVLTKEWREMQKDLPSADDLLDQIKKERTQHYETQLKEWELSLVEWEKNGKVGKRPNKPRAHKEVNKLTVLEKDRLGSLPDGWVWVKNNGLIYDVTSGSRDWKKFYADRGAYFIRTQDIKTNKLRIKEAAFVDLPDDIGAKRRLVEKGDLLMTITGANVGKVALVDFEIDKAYVSQSVALLKYVKKEAGPYLHHYFQAAGSGGKLIDGLVYGMGRPVLSLDNMRDVPVALCSLKEQIQIVREIESRLSVCDNIQLNIKKGLEKAEALRQSILKKAFEGKLLSEAEQAACRREPDWEPTERLLGEIRIRITKNL